MNEVEVKVRVKDIDALARVLASAGIVLSAAVTQDDTVFVKPTWETDPERVVLRIRIQNGKTILTLKKDRSNELDSIEREVLVDDVDQLRDMLGLLDFFESVRVVKTRRKGKWGEIELCLDEVVGLGTFLEAELLTEREDTALVQEELFEKLVEFGISSADRVMKGYDTMIKEQLGK